MSLKFTKMTGAGNDFVVIDNRSKCIKDGPSVARMLCDRRWGVGADGLLLLERSRRADYRMMYYNADGSYGGMCGNGGRCIALYAVNGAVAPSRHSFEALGYIYRVHVKRSSNVTIWMKPPRNLVIGREIDLASGKRIVNFLDTGSPHVVIALGGLQGWKNALDSIDVFSIGREVRQHRSFLPKGTNVNFVEKLSDKSLGIRTYERGVEDETLACGTGSIAVAIIGGHLWKLLPPIRVIPKGQVPLVVDFTRRNDKISEVTLTGPAEKVFEGKVCMRSLLKKGFRKECIGNL